MSNRFEYKRPRKVFSLKELEPYSLDQLSVTKLSELLEALPKYINLFTKYHEFIRQTLQIEVPCERIVVPQDLVDQGWALARDKNTRVVTLQRKLKVVQFGEGEGHYGSHSYFFREDGGWYNQFTPSKHPYKLIETRLNIDYMKDIVMGIGKIAGETGPYDAEFLLTLGVPRDEEHNFGRQKVSSLQEIIGFVRAGAGF